MPPRKYTWAYLYALRAWGDGYDVYTTAGIIRNVCGSKVREFFKAKEISWALEQKCFRPQKTSLYICAGIALEFLRSKANADLAEKEKRAAERRRDREEARELALKAQLAQLDGDRAGAKRLLTAVRGKLLDKTVAACIV